MHRTALLQLLQRYQELNPEEATTAQEIRAFVQAHDNCLERSCLIGHITASSWICSPDKSQVLLTHHRKLNRWLQLGGHVDGEANVEKSAIREAEEESGLSNFELYLDPKAGGELVPFDIDIHSIPARKQEPKHDHLDIRFLLIADPKEKLVISDESHDLKWVPTAELLNYTDEASILRMQAKASAVEIG